MNEIEILESTYFDTAKIIRYKEVETISGITRLEEIEICDIKCALSKGNSQIGYVIRQDQDINYHISYNLVMFCNPTINIKPGDKVIINQMGRDLEYIAGEPFKYPSHQEVPLTRKDET